MAGCPLASPRPVNMATRMRGLAHRRAHHLLARARPPRLMPPLTLPQRQRGRGLHVTKCVSLLGLDLMSLADKVRSGYDEVTRPGDLPGLLKALTRTEPEGRQVTIRELSKLEPSEFAEICDAFKLSVLTAKRIRSQKREAERLEQACPPPSRHDPTPPYPTPSAV